MVQQLTLLQPTTNYNTRINICREGILYHLRVMKLDDLMVYRRIERGRVTIPTVYIAQRASLRASFCHRIPGAIYRLCIVSRREACTSSILWFPSTSTSFCWLP